MFKSIILVLVSIASISAYAELIPTKIPSAADAQAMIDQWSVQGEAERQKWRELIAMRDEYNSRFAEISKDLDALGKPNAARFYASLIPQFKRAIDSSGETNKFQGFIGENGAYFSFLQNLLPLAQELELLSVSGVDGNELLNRVNAIETSFDKMRADLRIKVPRAYSKYGSIQAFIDEEVLKTPFIIQALNSGDESYLVSYTSPSDHKDNQIWNQISDIVPFLNVVHRANPKRPGELTVFGDVASVARILDGPNGKPLHIRFVDDSPSFDLNGYPFRYDAQKHVLMIPLTWSYQFAGANNPTAQDYFFRFRPQLESHPRRAHMACEKVFPPDAGIAAALKP